MANTAHLVLRQVGHSTGTTAGMTNQGVTYKSKRRVGNLLPTRFNGFSGSLNKLF